MLDLLDSVLYVIATATESELLRGGVAVLWECARHGACSVVVVGSLAKTASAADMRARMGALGAVRALAPLLQSADVRLAELAAGAQLECARNGAAPAESVGQLTRGAGECRRQFLETRSMQAVLALLARDAPCVYFARVRPR
jgi:hypothetical protein